TGQGFDAARAAVAAIVSELTGDKSGKNAS
ncbi:MAG: dephospho-CoA kinase, partial [Mesorhizobium sp.]